MPFWHNDAHKQTKLLVNPLLCTRTNGTIFLQGSISKILWSWARILWPSSHTYTALTRYTKFSISWIILGWAYGEPPSFQEANWHTLAHVVHCNPVVENTELYVSNGFHKITLGNKTSSGSHGWATVTGGWMTPLRIWPIHSGMQQEIILLLI